MGKVCRVLRVLEYVGEPEWVAETLAKRKVKGRIEYSKINNNTFAFVGTISEAVIGETPELLEYSALAASADRLLERTACPVCNGGRNLDSRNCTACSGLGYRDGSGPWPESAAEQASVSQDIAEADATCRAKELLVARG